MFWPRISTEVLIRGSAQKWGEGGSSHLIIRTSPKTKASRGSLMDLRTTRNAGAGYEWEISNMGSEWGQCLEVFSLSLLIRKAQRRYLKKTSVQGLWCGIGDPKTKDASKNVACQGSPSLWQKLLIDPADAGCVSICYGQHNSRSNKAFIIAFEWTWNVTYKFITRSWIPQKEAVIFWGRNCISHSSKSWCALFCVHF